MFVHQCPRDLLKWGHPYPRSLLAMVRGTSALFGSNTSLYS